MNQLDFPLKLHSLNRITGSHTVVETHDTRELAQEVANITRAQGAETDALVEKLLQGERVSFEQEHDTEHLHVELYASKHGPT
jgi:hypothetical protein